MDVRRFNRETLRDFILGGQDGLVNVLGLLLGVAAATNERRIVLIAGIAALMAESISMGAVAYTSSKAAKEYYLSKFASVQKSVVDLPVEERSHIKQIYYKKGFRGKLLRDIVNKIVVDRKLFTQTLMTEELRMFPQEYEHPFKIGMTVLWATVVGSLIPLIPFFFLTVKVGVISSLVVSLLALFVAGSLKAKLTIGSWKKSGLEMMLIGGLAALAGYGIGKLLEFL